MSFNSIQRFQKWTWKCLSQSEAGRLSFFFDRPEKQDVKILPPIKFCLLLFSDFREDENVTNNQRPGRSSCFSYSPDKHVLVTGRWYIAPDQVSLNSVQWFQRKIRKCLNQSQARASILFFRSARKNPTHLVEDVEILIPLKLSQISSAFSEEKSKMSQTIRGQGALHVFPISPKNTYLVEDFTIFLPIKFYWIPFRGLRGEVENASTNKRQGRSSRFPIGPKNTELVQDIEILLPVKFSQILFRCFRREDEKCLSQKEAGAILFFFRSARTTKISRRRWDLSCDQILLNSVRRFQRRRQKCLSQSEARAIILFFRSVRKTHNQ